MALRLGGLADIDPATVPLPPGTEVVTRVARVVDGELLPGGATGRVAAIATRPDGPYVEVAFVMALARTLTPRLEAARQTSRLPPHADIARAERVLRAIRDEAARRWLARAPGPWGADAPSAPEARFDD
jgi:hypothetical protein